MSYNPRMSMAPSSQQRQKQNRRKEDESDAFMRLSDHEIAGCISDIGVPLTSAELQKPEPKQIQLIFEWFAELLMNTTRESVEPAMRAAADDICGEFVDIISPETRNLMGFYVSLRRLLLECGINDFSFQDLIKPTHDRLVKIFSYVINFVRFREGQTSIIDEHFNKSEGIKERIETLYLENQEMEARLEEMKEHRKAMDAFVQEKTKRNNELKQQLLVLHSNQEKTAARFQNAQKKKTDLTALLREKTATTISLKQESAKLHPYVQQSPDALHASLDELSNTLNSEKSQIDVLDRRARALQTSTDTFNAVSTDVGSCVKVLEDVVVELAKEEEEMAKVQRQKDALSERGNNVREVQRTEAMLQRKLANVIERTDKLRESSREKANAAKARMEELRAVHIKLADERAAKGREMEIRRVRIEQTEKKMADLKENIENEIQDAQGEYLKLESHIKLYITEMEQAI